MINRRVVTLVGFMLCFTGAAIIGTVADDPSGVPMLSGTIKSATGKPLGGVAVSAQPDGKTFTKSVYSDENGEFYFPPFEAPFQPGKYRVWAQAVGFERANAEVTLASAVPSRQNLVLNATQDFT